GALLRAGAPAAGRAYGGDHFQMRARPRLRAQAGRDAPRHQARQPAVRRGAETTQITGVGSPAYMSPEQIREELVDHRTDIYSLGVVMYQMLTGKLPFQGTNKFSMIYQITQFEPAPPSSHRHEVPEALDRIVRRAMHKDSR